MLSFFVLNIRVLPTGNKVFQITITKNYSTPHTRNFTIQNPVGVSKFRVYMCVPEVHSEIDIVAGGRQQDVQDHDQEADTHPKLYPEFWVPS